MRTTDARLKAAERGAERVVAERAARLARRPITSAEEAVDLLIAIKDEPDCGDRSRAIMARLTTEARAEMDCILDEAIELAEAMELAIQDPSTEPETT
jgi:2-methylisocitrate lyase-like PEP mutase family enzyme